MKRIKELKSLVKEMAEFDHDHGCPVPDTQKQAEGFIQTWLKMTTRGESTSDIDNEDIELAIQELGLYECGAIYKATMEECEENEYSEIEEDDEETLSMND